MKATKSILNIQSILKDFSGLAEARKSYTLRTRLVFIFCGITIAMVIYTGAIDLREALRVAKEV